MTMDKSDEGRKQIRAAWKEFATGAGEHAGEEELVRYHRGELNDREQARVESHLAGCAECLQTLVDASEFLRLVPEGARTESADVLNRDFSALWRRIHPQSSSRQTKSWAQPQTLLPLAAGLLIALALALFWALSLRQENQRLGNLAQENRDLQEQSRRLQEQMSATRQRHETDLAELRRPEVNVPLQNIYPQGDRQRSASQRQGNRVRVPDGTKTFILILSDYDQRYKEYVIEIVDEAGRVVWKAQGLRRNETGELSLMLNRTLLDQKKYVVKLYGRRDGRPVQVAEYVVSVE
jgi:hypothetical protein